MNSKTKLTYILILISLSVLLVGCGTNDADDSAASTNETFTVGIVNLSPALASTIEGFKEGLAEGGFVEGENLTIIYEGPTGDVAALAPLAESMVEAEVDLIFAVTTPAAVAAQAAVAETDIPVIFAPINDPIASGLVESLSNPGGNMTGVRVGGFVPKELEWLLDIAPDTTNIFAPFNPDDSSSVLGMTALRETAESLGVELTTPEVGTSEEIIAAIAAMPEEVDAIFFIPDGLIIGHVAEFTAAATERSIPLAGFSSSHVDGGALFSYGLEFGPVGNQAARLAVKILEGGDPATLPVETTDFYLSVNLNTANEIGLEISDEVLDQAFYIVRVDE